MKPKILALHSHCNIAILPSLLNSLQPRIESPGTLAMLLRHTSLSLSKEMMDKQLLDEKGSRRSEATVEVSGRFSNFSLLRNYFALPNHSVMGASPPLLARRAHFP